MYNHNLFSIKLRFIMSDIKILDLKPVGRYADGRPYYNFHNPFPGSAKNLPEVFNSPEEAFNHGKKYVTDYERSFFPGGMGACLGVTNSSNGIGYQAVISTYYSNS